MLMLIKNQEANMVSRDFQQLNSLETIKTTHKIIMEKEMLMQYQIIYRVKLEKQLALEVEVEAAIKVAVGKTERNHQVQVDHKMMQQCLKIQLLIKMLKTLKIHGLLNFMHLGVDIVRNQNQNGTKSVQNLKERSKQLKQMQQPQPHQHLDSVLVDILQLNFSQQVSVEMEMPYPMMEQEMHNQ